MHRESSLNAKSENSLILYLLLMKGVLGFKILGKCANASDMAMLLFAQVPAVLNIREIGVRPF